MFLKKKGNLEKESNKKQQMEKAICIKYLE